MNSRILTLPLALVFATITAEARFLFGNPPERLNWVMAHSPLPKTLVRLGPLKGQSMEPVIHEGDMLRVESYASQPLLLGDVVMLEPNANNESTTHRITAQTATHIRTSGDGNDRSDGWHPKANIRWIVRQVERPSTLPRLVIP